MSAAEDLPGIGDNILDPSKMKGFLDRIQRLEEEKAELQTDIKEVFKEAKDAGFDQKILQKLMKRQKEDPRVVAREDEILEAYERSLKRYLKTLDKK